MKRTKKILALLLSVVMILSLLPSVVVADGDVAQIGEQGYATLQAAFAAVQDGQTITLLGDLTQDDGVLFDKSGVSATLDLGGHTFTVNSGSSYNYRAIKINAGTLTVTNGSIVAVGSGNTSSNGTGCYGAFRVEENGKLIANNLTLTNSRPWGLNVKVLGGEAVLTNVRINSSYGGGIEVTEADLGEHSKAGKATLTNCTFTQQDYFDHCSTAVSVSGGSELIVNSGSYTGEYAMYVFSSGGVIKVNDGTFTGRGNNNRPAIIAEIDTTSYPEYKGGLEIKGGSVTGAFRITSPAYMSITGGTFNADPTEYVAEGYYAKDNDDGTWTVIPYVARIGTTKYESLAAAIAAVPADGTATITMIAGETIVGNTGVTIPAGKNIVLDLNGQTLSQTGPMASASYLIKNNGTLTIKDSTDTSRNGNGTGKILCKAEFPDTADIPNYATNMINNYGTLTIESGFYQQLTEDGFASYVVDNYAGGTTNIRGGKLTNTALYEYVVRMFLNSTTDANTLNISGGEISGTYAVWMQYANKNANKASLNISGGVLNATQGYSLYAGAAGGNDRNSTNVSVSITGGTIEGTGAWFGTDTEYESFYVTDGYFADFGVNANGGNGFVKGGYFKTTALFDQTRDETSPIVADDYQVVALSANETDPNDAAAYAAGYRFKVQLAPVYVAQIGGTGYETLAAAVEAANADVDATEFNPVVVELLADVNVSAPIMISNHVTLDGGNHTITTSANRGIRIDTSNVTVTVKNLTISGSGMERAIQVDSDMDNVKLTIDHVTATATMYTVNICGSVDNLTLAITDSIITGWGAVNLWGNNGTVTISGSTLSGINDKSYNAEGWNDFGTIIVEGDTTGQTTEHASAYNIFISNTAISATQTTGNHQFVLLYNDPSMSNTMTLTNCTITLGNNCIFWLNQSVDGIDESTTKIKDTYMTGTNNLPELPDGFTYVDVADGYKQIAKSVPQANSVAKISTTGGDRYYTSLADAFDDVSDGETIVLLANAALTSAVVLNDGASITLDLNGFTTSGSYVDLYHGFLTVTDSGATKGAFGNLVYVNVGADENAAEGAYNNFTLATGTTMNNNVYVYQNDTAKGYGSKVVIRGTMNGLIFVLGNIHEGNTVVDVYGTINSDEDVGIALNGFATVNVYEGAHIEAQDPKQDGKGTGIEVRAGNLNVTGGTIIGHGAPTVVNPNGSGTTSTGAGIAVSQHTTKLPIDVKISGGTISGYSAFYESNPENNSADDIAKISISVTGGQFATIHNDNENKAVVYSEDFTGFISGGVYSDSITADYIATGYEEAANSHEVYTKKVVKASGSAVNTEDNTVYNTVEAGISAVVTNGTVDSITTTAAATVGSVTIENGGTVAVTPNGDSGVTVSGTTVVKATEVTITSGSETSAYAITKTVGNEVQGSTLATATLGNGMVSNANPSVYVKDVAEKLADAVLNSNAAVSSDLEVNLALDVVTKNEVVSDGMITLDVELQGVYTVNGTAAGDPEKILNSELATGASFTFRVAAPAGATKVNVVHSWTEDSIYGTGSETFYDLPVVDGYVEVTLTHFSSLAISTSSTFVSTQFDGDNTAVDFVYDVYMNLQDGLYMTYIVYVSKQSLATTAVLTDNGTEYVIPLSNAATYNASTFNASMRSSVITNGYYCAKYEGSKGDFYYFVVSKYPNHMAKNVSIKLTKGSETLTLYENTTMVSNAYVTDCTLYTLENNVFTTTMVKFLTGFKNAQNSSSDSYKIAATLLDYYAYAKALYGEN